jgi:MYXO-CTERM domain-containing protein
MARKFGPAILAGLTVAAIAAGAWWLVVNASRLPLPETSADVPGSWWWWPIGAVGVAALAFAVRRRDPLAVQRPAGVAARIVAVLAAVGAGLALYATRNT